MSCCNYNHSIMLQWRALRHGWCKNLPRVILVHGGSAGTVEFASLSLWSTPYDKATLLGCKDDLQKHLGLNPTIAVTVRNQHYAHVSQVLSHLSASGVFVIHSLDNLRYLSTWIFSLLLSFLVFCLIKCTNWWTWNIKDIHELRNMGGNWGHTEHHWMQEK